MGVQPRFAEGGREQEESGFARDFVILPTFSKQRSVWRRWANETSVLRPDFTDNDFYEVRTTNQLTPALY